MTDDTTETLIPQQHRPELSPPEALAEAARQSGTEFAPGMELGTPAEPLPTSAESGLILPQHRAHERARGRGARPPTED